MNISVVAGLGYIDISGVAVIVLVLSGGSSILATNTSELLVGVVNDNVPKRAVPVNSPSRYTEPCRAFIANKLSYPLPPHCADQRKFPCAFTWLSKISC